MKAILEILDRRPWLAALPILAWLGASAWLRPLSLPDEGRYVGVAWEMLRSGDWLTPTLNGLPFFHKPPLFYWLTAASLSVFGLNEGAARAAPLLGGTLAAVALFAFVHRWLGRRSAWLALAVLLTQPLFFVGSQFANLDMLVAGCITATVLWLADAVLRAERGLPHGVALAAACAVAALGVLAKGLIGALLPALAIMAWLLATGRWRRVGALLSWPGGLLFLVIALPWFVAMQLRHADFLHYFFVVQHFQRFATGGFNNAQPFWFYGAVLVLLGLPGTAWLWRAHRWAWWREPGRGDVRVLMGLWLVVVVVFFSLPRSKLVGYVLPALPPLALLIAEAAWPAQRVSPRSVRWAWVGVGVSGAIGLAAVLALTFTLHGSLRPLGEALRARQTPGEPVFVVGEYPFDLGFYARLRSPVWVVGDWADPGIAAHDNWRKELADAAGFATPVAAAVLLPQAQWLPRLCASASAWVVAPDSETARHAVLADAEAVASSGGMRLWRVDRSAAAMVKVCPGTPNVDPAGK